jgi:RNA polymerase sigma-70 factor (ECF subfamily)
MPVDDLTLVGAAQAGDRQALDTLLRRHYDRIFAVCRRVTANDADAADATQEAMLLIVRGLSKFDGRSSFGTWSYRVAVNASLDELRRRRRRPLPDGQHGDHQPHEIADPNAHDAIEALADRGRLDAALASLPDDFRVAVVLRDVADLDYAEVAEVLDIPVGTVKSRIARGRAALAEMLRDPGNQPAPEQRPT